LADEVVKRGVVASISPRQVGRFLKIGRTPTAPRDLIMLHDSWSIGYFLDWAQLGVPPKDRTVGPAPWTTSPASAA
jgi:hypothetical protein